MANTEGPNSEMEMEMNEPRRELVWPVVLLGSLVRELSDMVEMCDRVEEIRVNEKGEVSVG